MPAKEGEENDKPAQSTEDAIGPTAAGLQPCHALRLGETLAKIAYLAWCAWHDPSQGV